MTAVWIDQSARRKDAREWVCAGCGERWPRRLMGPPFERDTCSRCGGSLIAAAETAPDLDG